VPAARSTKKQACAWKATDARGKDRIAARSLLFRLTSVRRLVRAFVIANPPDESVRSLQRAAGLTLVQIGSYQQIAALAEYRRFLELWEHADASLPELAEARKALGNTAGRER
jgi:hypothetical protein